MTLRLCFLLLITRFCCAEVSAGVLEKYSNNSVFVGTGVRRCISFARAYQAQYSEIYFLDAEQILVEHSKHDIPWLITDLNRSRRFSPKNYAICHGDPRVQLFDLIKDIRQPITFLLSSYIPDLDDLETPNSILEELEQIRQHPINTHTILIENIHHAGGPLFGNISLDRVKKKLLEINSQYKFRFETGGHLEREENAILVAYIWTNRRYFIGR